jgi:hypothetical protein
MYLINSPKATLPSRVLRKGPAHRQRSAAQKAAIAAGILSGEVAIKLSKLQVARLVGVCLPYVNRACQLTPEARQSIADGFVLLEPAISDTELADIIRNAGIDRTLTIACTVEQSTAA